MNYASVTQIGVNNIAATVQNGTVDGSLNDMGAASFQNGGGVKMDSQAFVVGSIVGSSNSSINTTNSNNPTINNSTRAASIIAPLN